MFSRLRRQLESELAETRRRLEESERQRLIGDEQAEKSRRAYESEIALLKVQLSTFEEDFKSERRAREATAITLDRVRDELTAAQAQVSQWQVQTYATQPHSVRFTPSIRCLLSMSIRVVHLRVSRGRNIQEAKHQRGKNVQLPLRNSKIIVCIVSI